MSFSLFMNKQKHVFTEKRKVLAAKVLARKIGYLKAQDFPASFFRNLPTQEFNAHKIIRPNDELFVIQKGVVEIWHKHHDMLITELGEGSAFGEMPLLGQTMLNTQAIVGSEGVTLAIVSVEEVEEWIDSHPRKLFEAVGPRLSFMEAEHYRVGFQTVDLRLAGLLLDLAGAESVIKGLIHEDLAHQLGTYRETVTNAMNLLKEDKLVEVGRKKITLLNKRVLKELSEL